MYIEYCTLIVKIGANSKRIAENYAKEYTEKEGIQYLVFYHKKFEAYIVHKEEYLKYFIKTLGDSTGEIGQLTLTF